MPVYLVSINATDAVTGEAAGMPELVGLTCSKATPEAAVAWTVAGADIVVHDVLVEILISATQDGHDQHWFVDGPEDMQ